MIETETKQVNIKSEILRSFSPRTPGITNKPDVQGTILVTWIFLLILKISFISNFTLYLSKLSSTYNPDDKKVFPPQSITEILFSGFNIIKNPMVFLLQCGYLLPSRSFPSGLCQTNLFMCELFGFAPKHMVL